MKNVLVLINSLSVATVVDRLVIRTTPKNFPGKPMFEYSREAPKVFSFLFEKFE